MKASIKEFIKNFSFNFGAQLLSTAISIVTIFLIPKLIGTEEYGFIQLYLFYASYTSYLSFGISDGIYIRYGGQSYNEIDKSVFAWQYWIETIVLALLSGIIVWIAIIFDLSGNKTVMLFWAMISAIIIVPRSLITFLLLSTNNIKNSSIVTMIERILYFIICTVLLLFKVKEPMPYVYADIIGKIVSTLYIAILYKELITIAKTKAYRIFIELKENLIVGVKIVSAGIISLLIIGVVRLEVSNKWNLSVFGEVSLSLSVANLLLVFVNAISVVVFPVICRASRESLCKVYTLIDESLETILSAILALYYPIKIILVLWLPQYEVSMDYMALLFPICLFECKVSLLLNTYFKAIREEKYILVVNTIAATISIILTTIFAYGMHNLILTISVIPVVLGLRCIIAEQIIGKLLMISNLRSICFEIGVFIIFVICNWCIGGLKGFIIYVIMFIIYMVYNKKEFLCVKNEIKALLLNR